MRIKLRDIAEQANVSTATVSRVLNNNPNVDEGTRSLVLQVLNHLGYPIRDVSGVVGRESGKIFNVLHTVGKRSSDFGSLIMDGIEHSLRGSGIQMQIMRVQLENPPREELEQIAQSGAAIIIGGAINPALIATLEEEHIPFVLAAAHFGAHEVNCVHGNYMQGAVTLVREIASLGHTRIAFINGPSVSTTSHDKLAGYRLGLCEENLSYDPLLVSAGDNFGPHAGQEATQKLLACTRDFSAIIYATDMLAMGGMAALKEAGLEIPDHVSVAGFHDEVMAQFSDPPLTSVHIDWQRIGEIAATRLIALSGQRDNERLHIVIPSKVIKRASLSRAPQSQS